MNKQKLIKTFERAKGELGLDYAIVTPDDWGDCMSCVNSEILNVFGPESRGIWCKHWVSGMNASRSMEYSNYLYIAHDLTEEQGNAFIELLKDEGYAVSPESYDPGKCFLIE